MILITVIAIFFLLMIFGVPIAACLLLSSLSGLLVAGDIPIQVLVTRMVAGINSFPLLAIPFFILAGDILSNGGASKRLVDFANILVGRIRGGLAMVSVTTGMLLAGVSGSAVADASTIGSVLLPVMNKKGYDRDFSAAVVATSGTIGLIIPPSNTMVVYSLAAGGVSIGSLFLGGFIPGLLIGLSLMAVCYVIARQRNYPKEAKVSLTQGLTTSIKAIPTLMTIVIIIGGILSGLVTATEAAVICVVYALFISGFIYKELKWRELPRILLSSAKTTAMVMFLIAASSAFAWVMAYEQVPMKLSHFILSITTSKVGILLCINLLLLIVGMFMDMSPAILIFTPILLPIVKTLGVDPVHFGLIMMCNLVIGLLTPPVGTVLFLMAGMAKTSIAKLFVPLSKLVIPMIIVLLLITFFPQLVMFLPNLFMNR